MWTVRRFQYKFQDVTVPRGQTIDGIVNKLRHGVITAKTELIH
jgi:hypothetical protein